MPPSKSSESPGSRVVRVRLCQMFRRNEPEDYWLEINWDGEFFCSCGSEAFLISRRTLIGCKAEADHGSRNVSDINEFLRGHISQLQMRLKANGIVRH